MFDYAREQRTLGFMLSDCAKRYADRTFIRFRDESYTYAEIDDRASRIARGLHDLGAVKGNLVAVLLPNCAEYVWVQLGVARAGMVEVPLSTEAQGPLLTHFLKNAQPDVLITTPEFLARIAALGDAVTSLPRLVLKGEPGAVATAQTEIRQPIIPFEDLLAAPPEPPEVDVSYRDLLAIFYTSGTTGVSKGVMLPHHHNWHFPGIIIKLAELTGDDVFYTPFPYYHGVSQYMAVVPAMLVGGCAVIADKFSASRFWDEIRRYGVTVCWSVMTIPAVLMKQPEKPDDYTNSLRVMFGMGIDPTIWEAFEERFGVRFVNSYGSTETNLIIACPPHVRPPNRRTSGRATGDFEMAIVDESDRRLPAGEIGFIVSRPKIPFTQMQGYYRMPDETLKVTTNLWLHNGDMGYFDEAGWFYFTGRGKDTMRIGGENVSAQEIEVVLNSHPAVLECAVFAVSGDLGEDEAKADLRLRDGVTVEPAEIIEFYRGKLSKHMLPRYLQFRAQLPKTGTEKIQKGKLQEQGLTPETWDRQSGAFLGKG